MLVGHDALLQEGRCGLLLVELWVQLQLFHGIILVLDSYLVLVQHGYIYTAIYTRLYIVDTNLNLLVLSLLPFPLFYILSICVHAFH